MNQEHKIKVGISSCLLGNMVRYNGGHVLDRYAKEILGPFVEYVPVCPEVEMGLGIPRDPLRLVGDPDNPRLVTAKSGEDHTLRMQTWAEKKLTELAKENLCGFIFKSKSPSSGLYKVKVYTHKGIPSRSGTGIFPKAFTRRFPTVPVEEDGRLHNLDLRDNFVVRLFTFSRWKHYLRESGTVGGLVQFHSRNKLLIMAHSPQAMRRMGKLVAGIKNNLESALSEYEYMLMGALKHKSTIKKNINVMFHIMGYFKKDLSADEKRELLELIEHYRSSYLPSIAVVTLLKHYIKKYQKKYLLDQYYLEPNPIELQLRFHA